MWCGPSHSRGRTYSEKGGDHLVKFDKESVRDGDWGVAEAYRNFRSKVILTKFTLSPENEPKRLIIDSAAINDCLASRRYRSMSSAYRETFSTGGGN